jgi:hypothetical protein
MSEELGRALVVIAVIAAAIGIGLIASRVKRPPHPPVDVSDLGSAPGILIFTSTDCANCGEALALVRGQPLPVREVTNELEPGRLAAAGVEAVPLTIVLAPDGSQVASFAGVPPRRAFRRAVERASR